MSRRLGIERSRVHGQSTSHHFKRPQQDPLPGGVAMNDHRSSCAYAVNGDDLLLILTRYQFHEHPSKPLTNNLGGSKLRLVTTISPVSTWKAQMRGKFRATVALAAACILTPIGIVGSAAPAAAGNIGSCTSLAVDRNYIVGSCTPPNVRPGAQLKLRIECHVTGWRTKYVTLNYGGSFRVDSGCGFWGVRSVTYSPW
jgi:hypothetical protein